MNENIDTDLYAFLTLSYTDNLKTSLTKVNSHTVSNDHHLTCDECPFILSGNTIETHVSHLPINYIQENRIWHRVATSARVKIDNSIYFPSAFILHCNERTISNNFTFRFEVNVKIGKNTIKYAFTDLTYEMLLAISSGVS